MKVVKHLTSVRKYDDLQVHVRLVEADGARFIDVRDYVPSAKQYGRGVMLPVDGEGAVSAAQVGAAIMNAVQASAR